MLLVADDCMSSNEPDCCTHGETIKCYSGNFAMHYQTSMADFDDRDGASGSLRPRANKVFFNLASQPLRSERSPRIFNRWIADGRTAEYGMARRGARRRDINLGFSTPATRAVVS